MAIYVKKSGSFENVGYLYHKESDTWVQVEAGYHKIDGEWVKIYPGEFVKGEDSESSQKTVDPAIHWSTRETFSGGSPSSDLNDGARPLNLQAAFLRGGVDLSWEVFNPSLVEKYEIHRSDEPDGIYVKIGESASKQFVDTSIQGVYKFYKVRSILKSSGKLLKFTEFSNPEYGHVVDIDIENTSIAYSSPSLTTVKGNLISFDQAESARAVVKWKKTSDSSFDDEKNGEGINSETETPSVDLKVKYSSTPTSSLYVDNPGVNDGNGSGSFDKIVSNGNYIVTKTEQAVRLWDFSYNLKDTITYPNSGSNAIKDVAIRNDGYVGVAKRNDSGNSNAAELYEIDGNENLNLILEDPRPGGTSNSNYGYSVTFRQSNGVMAVGNVNGEVFYYDSSSDGAERRNYSSTSSNLNEFYELGYREYDGMLYVIRRGSGNRDPLLILDSSGNVFEEALGKESIAVADWNNFDGPNAGYLAGMDKETENFHVWDDALNKIGEYDLNPDGYTDRYPTSIHWKPDGGLLFTFDDAGFFAIHDSGFNLVQRGFTQEKGDGSADPAPLTDGLVLPDNKIFVSYDFTPSDSPSVNSDLKMLSSFEIGTELAYGNSYDVRLGLKNDQNFYSANTDNTFDTNIPTGPAASPADITFETFKVKANQERKTINLSWLVSDGRVPDSYNVYRANSENGSYAQIANVTDGISFSDSPGVGEYFYFVRIVESGTEYNQSNTKSAELLVANDMYFLDRNGASGDSYARQFRLTDVWDLDKAKYTQELNLDYAVSADTGFIMPPAAGTASSDSNNLTSAQSFSFKDDGSRFFVLRDSESESAGVWQILLSDPYQLSSWERGTAEFFDMQNQVSFPNGMEFRPNGDKVFVSERDAMNIYEYQLGTSWDITTASFDKSSALDDPNQSGESMSGEIKFKPNGTELFVTLDSGDIAKFALSTAWDTTTASFQNKSSVPDGTDGIYFAESGSRLYTLTANGTVSENVMKTKWEVTSKTKMNSSEYIHTENEEQVDLGLLPPEDNFDVPQNVQTSGDIDEEEITISWNTNSSEGIDYYNVYRSDSSEGDFTQINSSDVNESYYVDSNVSVGEEYYYKVGSIVNGSETSLSSQKMAKLESPQVFYDGFESDLSQWTTDSDFERKTDVAYAGSYSAGEDEYDYSGRDEAIASIPPTQISEISWYWQEGSSQYGSSLSLYNSNGNRELAAGTENPEWTFWDDTGYDDIIYNTGVYDTWMYIKLHNFDWTNGTYDYYYENTNSGHVETGTRSMNEGVDVSEIWLGTRPDDGSNPLYCRWDEIEVLE